MEERSIIQLSLVGVAEDSIKKMNPLWVIETTYILTEIVDGTLNSILSSDKLELVENDSLKKLLTSYPASIKNYKKREENLEKVILDIQRPIIEDYISLTDLLSSANPVFEQIKSKANQSRYEGLMNDIRWQNVLMNRYFATQELSDAAVELKQKSIEVFDLIKKELK
jgi:hypothetical protein